MLISFAQNFEDIMLHRVFADERAGFYIDVGAWDPDLDSITRLFYDRGWNGINIEPSRHHFRPLLARRPRDINLNIAIGSATGTLNFHEVPGSGLSSFRDDAIGRAARYRMSANTYPVQVETLRAIHERFCANREIHFLKVDVEGFEREVLDSADWTVFRPVIVLVEAIHPDSRQPNHSRWEPLLLDNGYRFVWFDGLNRFYLRQESLHLQVHFSVPPNITDGFVLGPRNQMVMTALKRGRQIAERVLPAPLFEALLRGREVIGRKLGW